MIKRNSAIILALTLTLTMLLSAALSGCSGGSSGGNSGSSGGSSGGSGKSNHVFIENEQDEIIMFQFEDEEHRQMVEEWLRTVLFAEDYYEFIDGEDYDAPYDFGRESLLPEEEE